MAEEFRGEICGGTWWNSSKAMINTGCSVANYDSSIVFPAAHDHKPQQAYSSDRGDTGVLIDSTLQMMSFGLSASSTTSDHWNQPFLSQRSNARNENYNSILEKDDDNLRLSTSRRRQEEGMDSSKVIKGLSSKSYTSPGEDSSITTFKPIINQEFSLEQDKLNSCGNYNSRPNCQSLSAGFPLGSSTDASYGYTSTLLQSLFESDPRTQQQSLFNNRPINNYMSNIATDGTNGNESWPKLSPFIRVPSLTKQQQPSGLHFSNNTPFWNDDKCLSSPQSLFLAQTFEEKPNCPAGIKTKTNAEEVLNLGSVMKKGSSTDQPPLKRPRIETPSSLPTFKVRKEKLGDRVTALQQLVSPFGKTDTASVLHEAIEYIKFLHDQVNVLSTPYMKQAATSMQQKQSRGMLKQDLRSRGLCLVPISSTFPVANDNTTADFWTPAFGGGGFS